MKSKFNKKLWIPVIVWVTVLVLLFGVIYYEKKDFWIAFNYTLVTILYVAGAIGLLLIISIIFFFKKWKKQK